MRILSAPTGRTAYEGDYILKEGSNHMCYTANSKGLSELRVVPALENGIPQPMIIGSTPGEESLSDAFIQVDMVSFFGPNPCKMICPQRSPGEDKGPIHHFFDYITRYVEENPRTCPPDWRRWQGKKEDGDTVKPKLVLSRPSVALLVQCYLVRHKGDAVLSKDGKPSLRYPVVFCIRASGAKDFKDKVFRSVDPNAPWGPHNNEIGDILDPVNGKSLIVEPYDTVYNNQNQTWYRCRTGEPFPLEMDDISAVWAPWEDILDITPSLPELGLRLAKAFNASTVIKVFERCPVYRGMITKEIIDMAASEGAQPAISVNSRPSAAPTPPPAAPRAPSAWDNVNQRPVAPTIATAPPAPEPDGDDEEGEDGRPLFEQDRTPAAGIASRVDALRARLSRPGPGK